MKLRINIILILLLSVYSVRGQQDSTHLSLNGQITTWGIGQFENPAGLQLGGRFVPALSGNLNLTANSRLDFEGSLNMNGSANFSGLRYDSVMGHFKPYRVWVRYSGTNWEIRTGLQQINFGSAKTFPPTDVVRRSGCT